MKTTRKLIRANGEEVELHGPHSLIDVRHMIGADTLDTVMLADRRHVMLVDDNGHGKGLPINEMATQLYWDVCVPGTTHTIAGDVVIVPDDDYARHP